MITITLKEDGIQIAQTILKSKEKEMTTTKKKDQEAIKTVKALKKEKVVEVLPPDPFIEIAAKVNKLTEKKSLEEVKNLSQDIDCNYFKLGGILSKISDEGWWAAAGYVSFKIFVQAELGMQYRKAMYLISIYNHLIEAGIPYEKVKELGWTKLRELAPVINETNVDQWVETAEGMNTLQLIEEIKDSKKDEAEVDEDKPVNDIKSKVFKLHADQREVIEEAIEAAKVKANTEFDAVALEQICLEYLGTPSKKKTVEDKPKKEEVTEVIDDYEEAEDGIDESNDADADDLLSQNEYENSEAPDSDETEFTEADDKDLDYDDPDGEEEEEEVNF